MTDNVKKTSELAISNNAVGSDRIVFLKDPAGVPSTRTITVANLLGNSSANVAIRNATPANSTINVNSGTIFYDSSYLYVAVANNVLKRINLQSF